MIHLALLSSLLVSGSSGEGNDDGIALDLAWKRSLGSAYSRVAADAELVVTQYGDGEKDYVVALDPADGAVRWRHEIGPVYRGHDGSSDGPISTPVFGEELVFSLGPRGRLAALARSDGSVRWTAHLVDDLGAAAPEYGFATTPVLEGGVLVVQAGGGEGKNLCGLDAATGELVWSTSDGEAGYQSPAVLELLGRRQLVVQNGSELLGVAPGTGEVLWRHALAESESSDTGRAGPVDDARFFAHINGELAVFELRENDGAYSVTQLVRSRELGRSYAQPVYHDGHFYGFKSSFLTCVDAETGRREWKSRPPGGRGLVLVGDRLIVFGAEGNVVVVRATPEDYVEEARLQAFPNSSYSWPVVDSGRVYVRNTEEIACLALVRDAPAAVAATSPPTAGDAHAESAEPGHGLGAFFAELAEAPDARERAEAFLAEQESFPIVEGDRVHFVWAGEAEDVAVTGSMTGGRRAEPLRRVPGTDLFHRSYPIEPGARWEYAFAVDFDPPAPDPRNPDTLPGRWSPMSEVRAPGFVPATHLAEPEGARGRLEELEYTSEQLGNTRALSVYLPPGYDESEDAYPLLLVHEGPAWLEMGEMRNSLDNLIGAGTVRPLVCVFVAPLDQWWFEAGGSRTEEYVDMLATELVPFLEERYRLADDPAQRGLSGLRGFGLTAAFAVVAHPEVFGRAGVQSVSLEDVTRHAFFERLASAPPKGARFYVDWNRYEAHDPDLGLDYAEFSVRLVGALSAAGCTVLGGEALDGHGWASWRSRTDALLRALFPAE